MEQIGMIADFVAGIIVGTILLVMYIAFLIISTALELGKSLFKFMKRKIWGV